MTETEQRPSELVILGKWKSSTIETEMGIMTIELEFSEHVVTITARSPANEHEAFTTRAPYSITKDHLITTAIFKGTPVQLEFDGNTMTLKAPQEQMVVRRVE